MATEAIVEEKFREALQELTTGLTFGGQPLVVKVGKGWPAVNTLQDVGRGQFVAVSIFNRGSTTVPRRYISTPSTITRNPCAVKALLSDDHLNHGDTQTITLSFNDDFSAVNVNDGIGVGAFNGIDEGATVIAVAGDTLTSLATKLAAAINARPILNTWMSASATGAVITLTGLNHNSMRLRMGVGNFAIITRTVSQSFLPMQVTIWANTVPERDFVADLFEPYLANLAKKGRIDLGSGERGRFEYNGSTNDYSETQKDVYEKHFIAGVEYSLRYSEIAYPILVGISTLNYRHCDD